MPPGARERSTCTSNYWNPAFPHLKFHKKRSGAKTTCLVAQSWRTVSSPLIFHFKHWGLINQSYRNKSGKAQPIRTKFQIPNDGIHGHVKGWQRSENFGRDRPILGKMEAGTSPAEPEFLNCVCLIFLIVRTLETLENSNCVCSNVPAEANYRSNP